MARKPSEFINHPIPFAMAPEYRAFCRYVVDGDTLDVFVDLGLFHYAYETVRLKDFNAGEIYRPKTEEERQLGYAAMNFIKEKILNKPVRIRTYKDTQSFGRYIADVEYFENDVLCDLVSELKIAGLEWSIQT